MADVARASDTEWQSAPGGTIAVRFHEGNYWDSGVTFQVTSPDSGSINEVTITPSGLEIDNSAVTVEVDGDSNAGPTGGTRQVQYKLEAGWVPRPDRVVDY